MKMSLFKKGTSVLIAVIMCLSTFIGLGTTTAFAAESSTAEVVMMSFPREGDDNFSGDWGHGELRYMNGWSAAETKKITVYTVGSWSGNACYCIEPGTLLAIGDEVTKRDETYWDNYPSTYNKTISADEIKLFIGRIFQYGYTGTVDIDWRSQNSADADKMAHIMATQTLIWETVVGERDSNFNHVDTGSYDAVNDRVSKNHPLYSQYMSYYNSMVSNVQKHSKVPSFFAKSTSKAQDIELEWNGTNYSTTLTDTNNVLGNYTFAASESGISFSVSGNKLTITANKAPTSKVSITATKNGSVRKGVVVWTDGVITPGSGIQDLSTFAAEVNDPVRGYLNIKVSLGSAKIVKTSEDGNVSGISFTITGNGVNKTVKTGSNGEIVIDNLNPGTYTVTEEIIDYYEPQEVRTVTIVSGQTATVTFNNTLKRGELKVVKTSEDNMVEGVQFKLSGTSLSGHTVEQFAVTDKNGVAVFEDVLITGHTAYTLEEVNVEGKYIVPDTQTAVIEWQKVTEKSFYNELKRGSVKVTKSSEDGFVEGVTFRLKGTSLSGETINLTAKTDHTGVAVFNDVLIGTGYVLTEENVAMRYVLPEAQNIDVKWNEVTGATVKNILKKWRADVFKVDADIYFGDDNFEEAVPMTLAVDSDMLVTEYGWPYGETQGDATLEGAVYGVFKDGVLLDTYTTDKNGYFLTDYYPCDGSYYYLQEISPSEGYLLDPYEYYVDAYPGNYTVELNTEYIDVYEDIIKGTIALVKHTDDGKTQIETPEVGAEFEVYLKSAGSFENGKDEEKAILVIDETGVAEIELPYGVYVVKQLKGWEGKELLPAFEVSIDTDEKIYRFIINNAVFESDIQIVKKDAETGKVIPAAGIGFKVLNTDTGEFVVQRINYPTPVDVEVYYTDETGMLMLPHSLPYGNYQIIEETISATGEYVLDTTPVDFKVDGTSDLVIVEKLNFAQKGTIIVTKQGEVFSSVTEQDGVYQPVYEIKGLAGAVYEITAAEDIVTLDGTTRYTKGEVIDTITTAADGTAESCELYLGKYQISEITAPFGMVLNGEKIDVELVYAGQEIAVTSTSASFVNERQKIEIDLAKNLEIDELFGIGNNGEISKVQFGLYAAEDMTAEDGKVIPKDGLIESAYCDENGTIAFTTDLPVGASVYIKEIATDAHYILSDTAYHVVFEYAGQDTDTVKISVNDGAAIENKIIRGNILGKKLDEDGFAICGALFGLFRENETEFTTDTALMTCESNEIGVFLFENVPYGRYVVREIKAAPAFVLNENSYAVTVSEDGETVEIVIENRFIVGSVQTTKVDKDYPENKLTGAVFEIYVDVDGNGEFNAEIDKLVGEMTEVETGVYRMDNLRYNGYFLYEKTAPEFFNKDDGYYYFEIAANGETVIVENEAGIGFVNTAKVGSLKIVKTSSDGVVEGFSFRVTGTNGYDEVFTTDANGEIIIENLRIDGEYVVSEVSDEKNADYILPEDKTAAVIEGSVTIVEMHNERKPEPVPEVPDSPQTGDNSNLPLWFGLMGLSGASLIGITLYSRKRRREEM